MSGGVKKKHKEKKPAQAQNSRCEIAMAIGGP